MSLLVIMVSARCSVLNKNSYRKTSVHFYFGSFFGVSLFERSDGVICVLSLSDSIFAIMLNGQMFSRVAFVKFMF